MSSTEISSIYGRRVWDSRGRPTVEVEVTLQGGGFGRAIAPAGASTGSAEALDLRDGTPRLGGFDVQTALAGVNEKIEPHLIGFDATNQLAIDEALIRLDGTTSRKNLGGNAMIATSMAVAHAAADALHMPLWQYLGGGSHNPLPLPEVQIFGGGAHANGRLDLQDFMIMPYAADSFSTAMEWVAEVYLAAGKIMASSGRSVGVADEGGYWPVFDCNEAAIETLVQAIELAGFNPEQEIGISLDIAATQFYHEGSYSLNAEKKRLSTKEWHQRLIQWIDTFPIVAIEDPFAESDFESHANFTAEVGHKIQVVGDDLLATNLNNIDKALSFKACNTLLCKPNQAGTLSEALAAFETAKAAGWNTIVSARSGETEDCTIVHLAIGWGIDQLKVGSFTRSERMAKWNEAIRIEDRFGIEARYAGSSPLKHSTVKNAR